MDEKVYKAGTTILIKLSCNFVGCDSEEEYTLESDMTQTEIDTMVWEMAMEYAQPEGYFEVIE